MNEAETRAELIDPALREAGWGVVEGSRVRREVITLGRLIGATKRTPQEIADYVLFYRNKKIGVIEAKALDKPLTEGVGQAKKYAEKLAVRFTYSTNGLGIYQIDMETGKEGEVNNFPTPEELWALTFAEQDEWRDRFSDIPFEDRGGTWAARYYQDNAMERALQAISEGKNRILLTLATGTGKTFIAFQLAWKLFHSRWNLKRDAQRLPRILFLADRNILADQAYNSFSAFPEDALVRIAPGDIRKKGRVPKNGSIFFTIFQTFMSGRDEAGKPAPYFGEYPPDFFDFIVIDECHRGGANDESNWRGILDYFSPAVQLGLTATPKRKDNVDTYAYFGEPVYVYSLKEGINDGFLTPFKVRQIATTMDDYIYTSDDYLIEGEVEEGRRYEEKDFNRIIEIKAREAYRVKYFMDEINQNEKTLVFCSTQIHALAVRDLINQMKTSKDPNYCVRVTANDGAIGEQHLRTFQDNEKTIPTILTTSQKLSTGVDARNIRNIVLMRPINSMIEFKQIIGRGTRLFEDKDHFTIYDFVKAYHHFSDEEWDGEPIDQTTEKEPEKKEEPKKEKDSKDSDDAPEKKKIIKIKLADGKLRTIQHMASTSFWGPDGKPISASEFITTLFGDYPDFFKDEDQLREIWSRPDTRKKLLEKLFEKGYGPEQWSTIKKVIEAEESDIFDVLAYVAFAVPAITREERVANHKESILAPYDDQQQAFIDFVLSQYVKEGVQELDQEKLPKLLELKYNAIRDATDKLGGVEQISELFIEFQRHLYLENGTD
ncbi:MAG: DEAD/DEAH box helicase family protein [Sphingomonadales bacterium]